MGRDIKNHNLLEDNLPLCVDAWKTGLSVCSQHNSYSELQFLTKSQFVSLLNATSAPPEISAELLKAVDQAPPERRENH